MHACHSVHLLENTSIPSIFCTHTSLGILTPLKTFNALAWVLFYIKVLYTPVWTSKHEGFFALGLPSRQ